MIKRVSYEIPEPHLFIKEFQQIYSTPPIAFKEYVSNSIDAINRTEKNPINLGIIVNKNAGTIILRDDGIGMTNNGVENIPRRIGLSSNREVKEAIGEKGLGLYAYVACGAERFQLYTRNVESNDNLFTSLTMSQTSKEAEVDQVHARDLPFGEFEHGTEVILSGIPPNVIDRYFTPSKIKDLVADFYSPIIRKGILKATVGWLGRGQKQVHIDPIQYRGELVLDDLIEVEYKKDGEGDLGSIHLYLFVNPDGKNEKVKYYNKGVKVYDSISLLDELGDLPWKSGKLLGEADEDFLTLNPQREGPVRQGTRYQLFIDILKDKENYLNGEIKRLKTRERRTREKEITDSILRNFDIIYHDFKLKYADVWVEGRSGHQVQDVIEKDEKAVPDIKREGKNGNKGRKTEDGNGKNVVEPSPDGKPKPIRSARRDISGNYATDFTNFDVDKQLLRSELDSTFGLIRINIGHSDYEKVIDDDHKFAKYTTHLLAQEIAYGEFIRLNGIDPQALDSNVTLMKNLAIEFFLMQMQISKIE